MEARNALPKEDAESVEKSTTHYCTRKGRILSQRIRLQRRPKFRFHPVKYLDEAYVLHPTPSSCVVSPSASYARARIDVARGNGDLRSVVGGDQMCLGHHRPSSFLITPILHDIMCC